MHKTNGIILHVKLIKINLSKSVNAFFNHKTTDGVRVLTDLYTVRNTHTNTHAVIYAICARHLHALTFTVVVDSLLVDMLGYLYIYTKC